MNAASARRLAWESMRQVTQRTRVAQAAAREHRRRIEARLQEAASVGQAMLEQAITPKPRH